MVLLAAASIAPAASATEARFKFDGGGFGHGVGMPQYGAYGAARAGWDAPRILGYFYRGAQLATIQPGAVRALITSGRARVAVSSATPWQIVDEVAQPPTALQLAAGASYTVTRDGAGFALSDQNGVVAARVPGQARLQPMNADGTLTSGARAYRGAMRLVPSSTCGVSSPGKCPANGVMTRPQPFKRKPWPRGPMRSPGSTPSVPSTSIPTSEARSTVG
jgi:hypothetical protein